MARTLDLLLAQVGQAATAADATVRYRLSEQLTSLAWPISTPHQVMQQHEYMYTEQVVAEIAPDLGIFDILAQSETTLHGEAVAAKCKANPVLTGELRLFAAAIIRKQALLTLLAYGRSYSSSSGLDLLDERKGPGLFAANAVTSLLSSPAGKGSIIFGFNILNKSWQVLPPTLKEQGYENPDHTSGTAFHKVFDTREQFFLFMRNNQRTIRYFHPSLTAFESPVSWSIVAPLAKLLEGTDYERPLFVDVGGGHGFQCAAFREATKDKIPMGRVINHD